MLHWLTDVPQNTNWMFLSSWSDEHHFLTKKMEETKLTVMMKYQPATSSKYPAQLQEAHRQLKPNNQKWYLGRDEPKMTPFSAFCAEECMIF